MSYPTGRYLTFCREGSAGNGIHFPALGFHRLLHHSCQSFRHSSQHRHSAGQGKKHGSSALYCFLFIPSSPDTEKQGRLLQATLLFCTVFCWIRQFSATSQCHADRQDIHTVGGVVGDLGDGLADHGCKVRIIGIEAQFGAMPDVGHMMQAVLTAIGGGQNYAVDLVGLLVQIKT